MTPSLLKLRKLKADKQAAAQKILDAIANGGVHRDMTPDETAQFNSLISDVATIKTQITQLQALDDETAADETAAVDAERSEAVERSARRSPEPGPAPAIHSGRKSYSILRALRMATDGQRLDGVEGECSQEIARRSGRQPKGFFLPTGADPEILALMAGVSRANVGEYVERTIDRLRGVRRDLTTTTGAGTIFTLPEEPFIELLRAKLVIKDLGATMLTDMKGLFAIPRQTGSATVYWVAEGVSASTGNPATDQVGFSPKVAIALTNISRKFMNQTSLDAEAFVKEDLALTMARAIDQVAINGSGGTQPLGILQNTTIQANSAGIQGGPNGAVPSFQQVVAMEAQVSGYNADQGKLSYLTSPSLRGALKTAAKVAPGSAATGYPLFLYTDGTTPGVGELNGYPARATTNVPSGMTKGTSSNCSALIYGDWSSLVVAQWEGVDMLVNPYTNQASGAVVISMEVSVDTEVRHPESFAIITDAKIA